MQLMVPKGTAHTDGSWTQSKSRVQVWVLLWLCCPASSLPSNALAVQLGSWISWHETLMQLPAAPGMSDRPGLSTEAWSW